MTKYVDVRAHAFMMHTFSDTVRKKVYEDKKQAGVATKFHWHNYNDPCNEKCEVRDYSDNQET